MTTPPSDTADSSAHDNGAPAEPPLAAQASDEPLPVEAPPALGLLARLLGWLGHPKAPLIAAGALAVGAVGWLWTSQGGVGISLGRPAIVLFDPVKFINAQRAAASIMALTPNADLALTLTQVAKQAEPTILEEARGAVVLVRQSVVVPEGIPDITDAVLRRFGLPTSVPTVNVRPSELTLESVAPTDSAFSAGKLREDYRLELDAKTAQLSQEAAKQASQQDVVP